MAVLKVDTVVPADVLLFSFCKGIGDQQLLRGSMIIKDSPHSLSIQPLLPVQGSADVLQNHELTARVISHLDSLRDIIVCSAVSKSWHSTVSNLAPTSLVIPGHDADLTVIATDSILYWVQQKQRQGHLHNLHTLSILLMQMTEGVA